MTRAMTSARPVLVYLADAGHGRALQIRLLFEVTSTAFEDRRISNAAWRDLKPATPWGHLPVLYDGDYELFDSCAITCHVASRVGLWPNEPEERARSIALLNAVDAMWSQLAEFARLRNPLTIVLRLRALLRRELPTFCARVEGQIRGRYITGDELSAADLSVYALFAVLLIRAGKYGVRGLIASHPQLARLIESVAADPRVREHVERARKEPR